MWISHSLLIQILKFFIDPDLVYMSDLGILELQVVVFSLHLSRNFLAAIIPIYYSIYLTSTYSPLRTQAPKELGGETMGTFAIEDFDIAMKSQLPVKYFR